MDSRYWAGAARSFLRNARSPGFLSRVARSGLTADAGGKASVLFLLDAYPAAEEVTVELGTVNYRRSNLSPYEQFALCSIAHVRQPATIFELGTYDGATSLLLARNVTNAELFTLDLPPESASTGTVPDEVVNAFHGVGSRFHDRPEAERIRQLFGDSRSFDFSPWFGTIDLVIVDAGHEYDCVAADTTTAFRLLRPGGVILWDDYIPGWPDVIRAVDETGRRVFRLANTSLAVFDDTVHF